MKRVLHEEQTRVREQTEDGGTHQINTEEVTTFKLQRTKEGEVTRTYRSCRKVILQQLWPLVEE